MSNNEKVVYATSNGAPYARHPYGAQSAHPGGPLLLQDFNLIDSLSHFDRERIPERVVHAKGGGAHGYFELTDSLSDITYARPFQTVGYKAPISMRFSTVAGERGSSDVARDPRGFSIKIRTDVGNLDWVFNNTPIFFIKDPNKFPHFIHSQKRNPSTNLNLNTDSTEAWDYWTQNPESIHQVTYLMGDRGIPKSWATMNGYSGHTYKFINDKEETTYVQIHVISDQGEENLSNEEAGKAGDDHNTQELYQRIESGNFPSWTLYVQTMTLEQAENFRYSINDLTKVWPHKEFPLRKFGKFVLNKNPENYFDEIEQIAFSPAHMIPGFEASNDPVLQSRLFSYSDTHRHRLGPNYQQLPVNRARTFEKGSGCPFMAGNFQREGLASIVSQGSRPNYISSIDPIDSISGDPKTYDKGVPPVETAKYLGPNPIKFDKNEYLAKERAKRDHEEKLWSKDYDYISSFTELDVEQPIKLYKDVFSDEQKKAFAETIIGNASTIRVDRIKENVASYWGLLDKNLGSKIANGLGVKYNHYTPDEYVKALDVSRSK